MVRQSAEMLGEGDRAAKVLTAWQEGWSVQWSDRRDPRRGLHAGVIRFNDAPAARAYYGVALDLQRKADAQITSQAPAVQLVRSQPTPIQVAGAEDATRIDRSLSVGGTEPVTQTTVLLQARDLIFEFTWIQTPADVSWLGRVVPAFVNIAQ